MVYFKDAEQLLLRINKVRLTRSAEVYSLSPAAQGEKFDPQRHALTSDIKAVSPCAALKSPKLRTAGALLLLSSTSGNGQSPSAYRGPAKMMIINHPWHINCFRKIVAVRKPAENADGRAETESVRQIGVKYRYDRERIFTAGIFRP